MENVVLYRYLVDQITQRFKIHSYFQYFITTFTLHIFLKPWLRYKTRMSKYIFRLSTYKTSKGYDRKFCKLCHPWLSNSICPNSTNIWLSLQFLQAKNLRAIGYGKSVQPSIERSSTNRKTVCLSPHLAFIMVYSFSLLGN